MAWRSWGGEETGATCGDEEIVLGAASRLQPPESLTWARGGGVGPATRSGGGGDPAARCSGGGF
jgi:hypothetical protein